MMTETAPALIGGEKEIATFDTQRTGRMGELVVELELLRRGWIVGNFNSSTMNSAGWDLFATKGNRSVKIRVKAKRPGVINFRWSAKPDGSVFYGDTGSEDDFVAAVSFEPNSGHVTYIVPARVVSATLAAEHAAWLGGAKANGGARKDTPMRSVYIDDRAADAPSHGFKAKWAGYAEAWDTLLEHR